MATRTNRTSKKRRRDYGGPYVSNTIPPPKGFGFKKKASKKKASKKK
jgi:hypothetical protein